MLNGFGSAFVAPLRSYRRSDYRGDDPVAVPAQVDTSYFSDPRCEGNDRGDHGHRQLGWVRPDRLRRAMQRMFANEHCTVGLSLLLPGTVHGLSDMLHVQEHWRVATAVLLRLSRWQLPLCPCAIGRGLQSRQSGVFLLRRALLNVRREERAQR